MSPRPEESGFCFQGNSCTSPALSGLFPPPTPTPTPVPGEDERQPPRGTGNLFPEAGLPASTRPVCTSGVHALRPRPLRCLPGGAARRTQRHPQGRLLGLNL